MGLFANPLSHAGYPPGVTGTPETQPSQVRAATLAEAAAGTLDNVYISPVTLGGGVALDFASPPVLGFGSTTPRPVAATTLTSSGVTSLATAAATASLLNGAQAGTATLNIASGAIGTSGALTINIGTGAITGSGSQALNLLSSGGLLGVFGATPVVKQTQAAITNSVTAGGTTSTIANFTNLTTYATDAPTIRNDIYQLALSISGIITALKNYGIA